MKPLTIPRSVTVPSLRRLASGVPDLDDAFHGGLVFGSITEWGVPLGRGGREIVLRFLAAATRAHTNSRPLLVLWIFLTPMLSIYPPAWEARGITLTRIRFARSCEPLRDLKPVFLDPVFSIVVLDALPGLDEPALAYLAAQARRNGQMILLLRNELLGNRYGNVWAKQRVNCWREGVQSTRYAIQPVRGLPPLPKTIELAPL